MSSGVKIGQRMSNREYIEMVESLDKEARCDCDGWKVDCSCDFTGEYIVPTLDVKRLATALGTLGYWASSGSAEGNLKRAKQLAKEYADPLVARLAAER